MTMPREAKRVNKQDTPQKSEIKQARSTRPRNAQPSNDDPVVNKELGMNSGKKETRKRQTRSDDLDNKRKGKVDKAAEADKK